MRASPEALPALFSFAFLPARWRTLVRDAAGYFLVSLLALITDYGLLVIALRVFGWNYLTASATGFIAGLAVAYGLSVVFVFSGRRRLSPVAELAGFLGTGLAGLAITQIAMAALVTGLGLPPEIAKAPVAVFVFLFNFFSRRLLFTSTQGAYLPSGEVARNAGTARERVGCDSAVVTPHPGPADRPSPEGREGAPRSNDNLHAIALTAIAATTAAAIFALAHPYRGIVGDADIYIGRGLADLDPAGIGRDLMFRFDGQSSFSVFTIITRALLRVTSPEYASQILSLAATGVWFAGLSLLVWRVAGRAV